MAVITDLSADLLSDVFYTVLRSSPREGLQTLAALARTCSAFFDSAANILWRSVPSLTLLAFLLPQDAWCISGEEKERRSKHAVIILRRPLLSSDFARFDVYTHRVKEFGGYGELTMGIACEYVLSPDAFTALYHPRFSSYLFPALKSLDLSGLREQQFVTEAVPTTSILFSPGLETVTITSGPALTFDQEQQGLRELLRLPEKCPQLPELSIYGAALSISFVKTIADIITRLEAIRVLRMPDIPVTMNTFRSLSNSRSLEQLTLCVQPGCDLREAISTCRGAGGYRSFALLEQLSVTIDTIHDATQLLAYVTSSHLSSLRVNFRLPATPEQLEELFKTLSRHPSRLKVHELITHTRACPADLRSANESPEMQHGVTLHNLLPLLDLGLRSFVLSGILVDIDDEDLKRMARAWPELKQLALGVCERHPWMASCPPRATLFGLIPIFQYCPRIEGVGYRMKTDIFDSEAAYDATGFSRPGKGVVCNNAVELSVGDSRIDKPAKVASFLSDICPRLVDIHHVWLHEVSIETEEVEEVDALDEEDMYRKWGLVMDYVLEFVLIRQQERNSLRDRASI